MKFDLLANLGRYQPKQAASQPTERDISQSRQQISQTSEISAKADSKSANRTRYQPKQTANQPNQKTQQQTSAFYQQQRIKKPTDRSFAL
ncbi:hypothetical protein KGR20_00080 [Cytobacillus oceanisediminis]|uniref:Uncharacterized protein n=1 Tax=Niallia alba TaxID=2729105 RepID=A0A7Y0PM52_9BACI|nr:MULTISPECIES: hypothetical protein [Bacillaceae]MBZ9532650.1 hypothetical protein [Cytobacillus oceanisediminis]NMO77405.1 hypothetical protein [Niallia alba]